MLHLSKQGIIRIQQTQGKPAAVRLSACLLLKDRDENGQGLFYGFWITNMIYGRFCPLGHPAQGMCQSRETFFVACNRGDDRNAELFGQKLCLYLNSFLFCFVCQIHTDNDSGRDLHGLKNQVQVSLQTGCITDDGNCIRFSKAQEITGNLFLGRVRHERIGARKVDQDTGPSFAGVPALGVGNRLARPVSRVLLHAGQAVENGAFSHIGISCKSNDFVFCVLPLDHKTGIQGFRSGRMAGKTHRNVLLRLYHDILAVFCTDGDNGAADQVGGRIAERTVSKTHDFRMRSEAQIHETPAHGAGGVDARYAGTLSGMELA